MVIQSCTGPGPTPGSTPGASLLTGGIRSIHAGHRMSFDDIVTVSDVTCINVNYECDKYMYKCKMLYNCYEVIFSEHACICIIITNNTTIKLLLFLVRIVFVFLM